MWRRRAGPDRRSVVGQVGQEGEGGTEGSPGLDHRLEFQEGELVLQQVGELLQPPGRRGGCQHNGDNADGADQVSDLHTTSFMKPMLFFSRHSLFWPAGPPSQPASSATT